MVVALRWAPLGTSGVAAATFPSVLPTYLENLGHVLGRQPGPGPLPTPPPPIPTGPAPLKPDLSRKIWSETNVDVRGGFQTKAAYDLDFYPELGSPTRGVLVVTVICSFIFKDGPSQLNPGTQLVWTPSEKQSYMTVFKNMTEAIWNNQHRLTTAATGLQPITDAGVIFDIRVEEEMFFLQHSHWNLHVVKVDDPNFHTSTTGACGGGVFTNGSADLDSLDILPTPGLIQRAAPHEFGHMLGYRDEYVGATVLPNTFWNGDTASIMNIGETVQERHYVFFADWLSQQRATSGSASSQSVWKVNGRVDMSNANI